MLAKRILDLTLVIPGLLVIWPFFLVVSIWIKMDSNGPVFFRQERVGRNGKLFRIYKFRTMMKDAESVGPKVTAGADPRITRSGTFLRKYKLDELPQLINVLKGEMSIVGPRPEVPEFVVLWPEDLRNTILSVSPGITDIASIEYRNENELLEGAANPAEKYITEIMPIKLRYYATYIHKQNLLLDVWLIIKTVSLIFKK